MLRMSIDVMWLPVVAVIFALLGYAFRSNQILKSRKRVLALENEMLGNHAEILKLQQELMQVKDQLAPSRKSRVVTMGETSTEEGKDPKDAASRKKNIK